VKWRGVLLRGCRIGTSSSGVLGQKTCAEGIQRKAFQSSHCYGDNAWLLVSGEPFIVTRLLPHSTGTSLPTVRFGYNDALNVVANRIKSLHD
jgi:hypothetical protein